MAKVRSMEDLFIDELKDLYDAEKQIIKALPKMCKAVTSEELRAAFQSHLETTKRQVERLEQIFGKLNLTPKGKTCHGMQGLIDEGEEIMEQSEQSPLRDAGLIAAAQKVEHYEMASYGTARTFAQLLGHHEAAQLLETTLNEEKETDEKLTGIAESVINEEAMETSEQD